MNAPSRSRETRALAMMCAIAARIAERRPPEEILQSVLAAVRSVLDVDTVAAATLEPTGASVMVRAASAPELVRQVFPEQSLPWCVATFGRAEAVPDLVCDPRRGPISRELPFRRTLCGPFRAKGVGRGALLAGSATPGALPSDAADLALLVAFGELAAHAIVAEAERQREEALHRKLERLASVTHVRLRKRRDFDETLRGIAERKSLDLYEEHRCEPLLRDVVAATGAVASAIAVRDGSGRFRIADAYGLKAEEIVAWVEEVNAANAVHGDHRMTVVTTGEASGFPHHREDLRVEVPCEGTERVLHVLSARGRLPFGREDQRCAEIIALQIAALAERQELEAKLDVALTSPDIPLVLVEEPAPATDSTEGSAVSLDDLVSETC